MRLPKLKILFLSKIRISCKFLFCSGKNIIENLRTFSDFCGNDSFLLSISNPVQISQDYFYVEKKKLFLGDINRIIANYRIKIYKID